MTPFPTAKGPAHVREASHFASAETGRFQTVTAPEPQIFYLVSPNDVGEYATSNETSPFAGTTAIPGTIANGPFVADDIMVPTASPADNAEDDSVQLSPSSWPAIGDDYIYVN